jgi:hypothetical protein
MDVESIFIPRTDLAEVLDRATAESAAGGLRLVWLFGETGQGKTSFLRNYLDQRQGDMLVSYAHCSSPLGSQSTAMLKPHQPLKDVIENIVVHSRRRLTLIKNISLTVLAMLPVVGEVAYGVKELRRDLSEFRSGKREVDFSSFVHEYFNDLTMIAEESPVLAVIDDVQWADTPTIEALTEFFLDPAFASARITFVLAARREEIDGVSELVTMHSRLSQTALASEHNVRPFTERQMQEYVRARFPAAPADSMLIDWLRKKTGGNPFFVYSYIQHLLSEGMLLPDGSVHGELESYLGLPAEIRLVTSWLMKSLGEEDLDLLLTASVLGNEFSLHELMHLTRRSSLELIRILRRIKIRHGIVEPEGFRLINGRESTVFHFTQHTVHTALYNELTVEEREELHRITAHYLNGIRLERRDDPDALNSVASALMLHARLGHQPDLEYQSILLKAQHTFEQLADAEVLAKLREVTATIGLPWDEALQTYQQALSLAPITTRRIAREPVSLMPAGDGAEGDESLTSFLPRVLRLLSTHNEAEALVLLEQHLARASRRGASAHPLVQVLYALACHMGGHGDERALQALRSAADSPAHAGSAALAQLGFALFRHGDDVETLSALRAAVSYTGRHAAAVHALAAHIVRTSFAGREEYAVILAGHPLKETDPGTFAAHYPRTSEALHPQ